MKLRIFAAALFAMTSGGIAALELSIAMNPERHIRSDNLQVFPAFSISSTDNLLATCETMLARPNISLLPTAATETYQRACDARAREILAGNRSNSYAMYVLALSALARGETSNMLAWLSASSKAAPNEGWLSERRFTAAALLPEAPKSVIQKELPVLLSTQTGSELLIRHARYRRALVPMIREALEKATPAERQRFYFAANRLGLSNV